MKKKQITLDDIQIGWLLAILEDAEQNIDAIGYEEDPEEGEEYLASIRSIFDAIDKAEEIDA